MPAICSFAGESDRYPGPAPRGAVDSDRSVVGLDNRLCDRQAQSAPTPFSGAPAACLVEPLKNQRQILRGYAWPLVGHVDGEEALMRR
jgi:hypothetical protein